MDVQQKVAALIRRYKTDDPFRLAACKNIIIMYSDLGGKYGNYLKYKRSKFIIIDDTRTPEAMLPFVCAHELGHALCTPNDNTSGSRPTPWISMQTGWRDWQTCLL